MCQEGVPGITEKNPKNHKNQVCTLKAGSIAREVMHNRGQAEITAVTELKHKKRQQKKQKI